MNFEQREKQKALANLEVQIAKFPLDSLTRGEWVNHQNPDYRLWVVEFESANYCGAPEHCLVWAFDAEDAMDAASYHASEVYCEQDAAQWEEEHGDTEEYDDVMWASMNSAVLLEGSEYAVYVEDGVQQRNFYPIVN